MFDLINNEIDNDTDNSPLGRSITDGEMRDAIDFVDGVTDGGQTLTIRKNHYSPAWEKQSSPFLPFLAMHGDEYRTSERHEEIVREMAEFEDQVREPDGDQLEGPNGLIARQAILDIIEQVQQIRGHKGRNNPNPIIKVDTNAGEHKYLRGSVSVHKFQRDGIGKYVPTRMVIKRQSIAYHGGDIE